MEPTTPEARGLARAFKIFEMDLNAIPEDAFNHSFGPKARTVADIVHEVNLVNDDICRVMRGDKASDWPEGWITAPTELQSKSASIASFMASSQAALELVCPWPADKLAEPLATEDGETTRAERCRFMTLHLWYHSGQLNFIQTLLGDDGWHWS